MDNRVYTIDDFDTSAVKKGYGNVSDIWKLIDVEDNGDSITFTYEVESEITDHDDPWGEYKSEFESEYDDIDVSISGGSIIVEIKVTIKKNNSNYFKFAYDTDHNRVLRYEYEISDTIDPDVSVYSDNDEIDTDSIESDIISSIDVKSVITDIDEWLGENSSGDVLFLSDLFIKSLK